MERMRGKVLVVGMTIATLMFGMAFTSVRTNAIGAESFEAYCEPSVVMAYDDIQSLEDLVSID